MPLWSLFSRQVTASTVLRLFCRARGPVPQWRRFTTATIREDEPRVRVSSAAEHVSRLKEGDAGFIRDPYALLTGDDALDFILAGYEAQPKRKGRLRPGRQETSGAIDPERYQRNPPREWGTIATKLPRVRTGSQEQRSRGEDTKPTTQMAARRQLALDPKPQERKVSRLVRRRIKANAIRVLGTPHRFARANVRRKLSSSFALSFWRTRYAKLARKYDTHTRDEYAATLVAPHVHAQTKSWATNIKAELDAHEETVSIHVIAEQADQPPERVWMSIALYFLHYNLESLPGFLQLTGSLPFCPAECVADCLQYLAQHHTIEGSDSETMQKLASIFCTLAERSIDDPLAFYSSFVRLLLPHCSHEQVSEMYRAIKVNGVRVHWNSLLHLTAFFAKNEHFDQALDALLTAHGAGADLKSVPFRSACSTLLRKAMRQPGGLRVCLRLIDNLVSIGVQLNNQLCNIVMLNAVEAGDLGTAFSIFRSLMDHGLDADAYTYAILLKGCKMQIDDADTLNDIVRCAVRDVDVLQNPVVATEILHCLSLHHTKVDPENAFATVAAAYTELFDSKSLLRLGLPIPDASISATRGRELQAPPPQAIGTMLNTYLYHATQVLATRVAQDQVHSVYERFRELAVSGQEPFDTLIETDYIANSFLMAFNHTRRTLVQSAQVVRDMQQPLPKTIFKNGKAVKQCQPTAITWTIFLNGFRLHRQMKLAAQVLNYMRSKNIEPDDVTWNSLVAGYAHDQDIEGVVDTLRQFEASGAVWDRWTYGGLRRLRDQQRLREELENARRMKQLDFTSELRESLEKRFEEGSEQSELA